MVALCNVYAGRSLVFVLHFMALMLNLPLF